MKHTASIPIASIRLDGGTQPRSAIDFETVFDYMDAMGAGAKFPPVVVFYDGANYWLADGFHRVKAVDQGGSDEIVCDLRQGTQQDAQWYSFGANKTNGLRRTNDDKHRAVRAALLHPNGAQLSNRQISAHVGVDEGTVRNWRDKLTAEIPQSPKRKGRDGRTINVTNIGKSATHNQTEPAPQQPQPPDCGDQPSADRSTTAELGDDLAWTWCQRLERASVEIAMCPVSARDLAETIRRRGSDGQLTKQLEKTRDFITAVLAQNGIE